MNFLNFLIFDSVGCNLFHSSLEETSLDPGLVDSPPTSKILHPSLINFFACNNPFLFLIYFPPSEKLSGVKLRTPIKIGNFLKLRFLIFFFLEIFFKSEKILFLISPLIFLISKILSFLELFLVISSIMSNEIELSPYNGSEFFFLLFL